MSAPQGNQFWKLRSKHGRDKLFSTPDDLWNAACEYFEWCDSNPFLEDTVEKIKVYGVGESLVHEPITKMRPYTLQGLCRYLGCSVAYFYKFEDNNNKSDDFINILTRIRETIYEQKFSGAAAGFFNANLITRDLGLVDKQSHEVKEQPLFPDPE